MGCPHISSKVWRKLFLLGCPNINALLLFNDYYKNMKKSNQNRKPVRYSTKFTIFFQPNNTNPKNSSICSSQVQKSFI